MKALPDVYLHKIMCVALGLALPLFLIPVVSVLGFSEIVEELAKALAVVFVVMQIPGLRSKIIWASAFAVSFGISETVLYIVRIIEIGDFHIILYRLFLTVPMHVLTALVILFSANRGRKYIPFGLISAIVLHLAFNYFVYAAASL